MVRDYAISRGGGRSRGNKRRRPAANRRQKTGGTPRWVWIFCGLCICLSVLAGIYVFGRPAGDGSITIAGIPGQSDAPAAAEDAVAEPDAEKSRFAFYEMLPNHEVVISEPRARETPPDQAEPSAAVAEPGSYVIQAGSFRNYDDAERRKAGLALLGVEAEIEKVEIESGRTVYRVRTDPVAELKSLNSTLERLRSNGIDTLVMHAGR